jgi:hypothetical protein
VFSSGLDLDQFVTNGAHPWYDDALKAPATQAEWLVAYQGDAIWTDMEQHPSRFAGYHAVYRDARVTIYKHWAS